MVYNANGLYPQKAQILNELNSPAASNEGIMSCHRYSFEKSPEAFDLFTDRAKSLGSTFSLFGMFAIDLVTFEKFLMPKTKVRIKLIQLELDLNFICCPII